MVFSLPWSFGVLVTCFPYEISMEAFVLFGLVSLSVSLGALMGPSFPTSQRLALLPHFSKAVTGLLRIWYDLSVIPLNTIIPPQCRTSGYELTTQGVLTESTSKLRRNRNTAYIGNLITLTEGL